MSSFKTEADGILIKFKPVTPPKEPAQILENLFLRFHIVAKQLQKRQRNRQPLEINDEYDVQDLLHGLLKIFFDDVRPEEYCPSYAGTSPRVDFYLKKEQILVEAKMASTNHRKKKVAEELVLDKEYYRKKEGCQAMYALVYEPEEVISNPRGFESDLCEKRENFEARFFVVSK
ncbi:MAG: hypothetical protein ACE14S_00190 [Candidatus Bathyarchaeia archaeon]